MKKILIFGGAGLLGSELKICLENGKFNVYCPTRVDFNVKDYSSIDRIIQNFQPDFVINCLAEISVEKCQNDNNLALAVNSTFPHLILLSLKHCKVRNFIQISTSDVFYDSENFIKENEIPRPINKYGRSKSIAENLINTWTFDFGINYNIIRIGWLYGKQKRSFVDIVAQSLLENKTIQVINDQYNIPVYNKDLAYCIYKIIRGGKLNNKILHFSSHPPQKISKYDIALTIAEILKKDKNLLIPVSSKDIFKVPRPKNVCLAPSYDIQSPVWMESLCNYLNERNQTP